MVGVKLWVARKAADKDLDAIVARAAELKAPILQHTWLKTTGNFAGESTPQDLVELLKHPFCVGGARRAVLDALEFTYKRSFKDQWEFVEYAQKHQPQLDLLTPPKRPEPKP